MRDRRIAAVLAVSLSIAVLSGVGVYRSVRGVERRARIPVRPVIVAAHDLQEGHVITRNDVHTVSQPVAAALPGSYRQADSVVGRVTKLAVFAGEALVPGRLAPVGAGAGLEVKISAGKRAMSVKIDEVAGLAGLLQPNSRVDVLVALRDDGSGTDQHRAKLFMSDMRVLSIGAQIERGPDGRPMNATTATLEVSPIEAEQLAVAASEGKIQLVLRGYGDQDTVVTTGASTRDVMQRLAVAPTPPRPTPKAPAKPVVVEARPIASASPPIVSPLVAPLPPRSSVRPVDSTVVQVYRRDKVTQQKIARHDSGARGTAPNDSLRFPQ